MVEQFAVQALVEPFDLSGGGRGAGFGVAGTIPFSRQIRSNITSAGRGLANRPVNCLPLSVSTSSGNPYTCNAPVKAWQTAQPVARRTTVAIRQNREWSSTPTGSARGSHDRQDQPLPAH
jgi:hypothetical protein